MKQDSIQTHGPLGTGVARRPTMPHGRRAGALQHGLVVALPYAALAAVVVLIALPMINYPFGPDQAIFATIGNTIWHGGFPYTDAWDQKPPSIYLIYAIAIHGPLGVMGNLRAFDLAWMAATTVVLMELGRRWWNLGAGLAAGLLYGAVYGTTAGWWFSAQPDVFIALPLCLALLTYDSATESRSARRRRSLLVTAGVLLGFAFQLRFIMAALIPFFPFVEMAATPRRRWLKLWLSRMLWLGAGFLAFQIVILLYLVAGGALGEYIAATRWASGYTRLGGPYAPQGLTWDLYYPQLRFSLLFWLLSRLLIAVPAVVGGFFGVFVLKERRVQQLALFVVFAYVGIAAQAKFFLYHYFYMLAFLTLLAGWALDRYFALLSRSLSRGWAAVSGALVVTLLLLSTPDVLDTGISQWKSYIEYYRYPEARDYYYDYFGPWNGGTFSYRSSRETAYYVQRRTRPGDSIYVWGYDPLVYLLTGRPHASRFIYSFPLMTKWAPPEWKEEFIQDIEKNAPVYFIIQRYEGAPWITGLDLDSGDYVATFTPLQNLLDTRYELETEIEDYLIYRLRE